MTTHACQTYSAKHSMCLCGMPHGDVETFTAHGCKCRPCREAGTSTSTSMSTSATTTTTTTQTLVRKRHCPAYDPAAKVCRCGNAHGSASTYSNHACRCQACREAQRGCRRQQYAANLEREREYRRQQYAANAEGEREYRRQQYAANVERERESGRQRRAANPERAREYSRRWYMANAERERERQRQWQQNNPEKNRARKQRRRARKMNAPGNLHDTTIHTWWFGEMVNLYRACPVCEVQFDESEHTTKPTLDHIVPLVKGGHHDTSNGTILCHACNCSKCDSDMDTWLAQRREALGLPPLD